MRTGRSLTVCRWGVSFPEGSPWRGGGSPWQGVVKVSDCIAEEGCLLLGGSLLGRGSPWWRGLLPGGPPSWGGLLGWGVPPWGGGSIPACTEADPPPVDRITDTSKNITLATTSLRPVTTIFLKYSYFSDEIWIPSSILLPKVTLCTI